MMSLPNILTLACIATVGGVVTLGHTVLQDDHQAEPGAIDERPRQHGQAVVELSVECHAKQQRCGGDDYDAHGREQPSEQLHEQPQPRGDALPPAGFPVVA